MKAFSYKRLNDTAAAKRNFNEYFTRQNPDKIEGGDYAAYAGLLVNYPNNEALVMEYTNKAIALDTLPANKASYVATIAAAYEAQQNSKMAGIYYGKLLDVKKNISNVDIFNAGYQFYNAAMYDSTNKYFTKYTEKFPEDIMGYYMLANSNSIIDSTQTLGLAVPYYEKTIEIALKDTSAPRAIERAITSYKYFVGYHANTTHDKAKAMAAVESALVLMPNDPTLLSYKEAIKGMPDTYTAPATKTGSGGASVNKKQK